MILTADVTSFFLNEGSSHKIVESRFGTESFYELILSNGDHLGFEDGFELVDYINANDL